MQAVALLLVASTMGGEFPTNPNAYSLPPVLESARPTKGRSLLDQAMQATANAAAETTNAAGNSLRRNSNTLRHKATSTRNRIRRAAGELSLSGPTGSVAQAQYQQQNGNLKRPVDGLVGPGNRAAATDPTQYRRNLQPVPPATGGYNPAAALTPAPAPRTNTTPAYRPPALASGANNTNTNNTNTPGYSGLELPPLLPADKTPLAERNYGNTTGTPGYTGGSVIPPHSATANNSVTPSSAYRPPSTNTAPYGTNAADPYGKRKPADIYNAAANSPGSVVPPAGSRNLSNANNRIGDGLSNASNRIGDGISNAGNRIGDGLGAAGDAMSNEVSRAGGSYFMTLLALFASVGLNLYLGWIAWDTYNRYQDLVSDMRTTGSRRERRPERRRFTETSAAAY